METHQHHQEHTGRKRSTHYLWEFLMLFLAVFAGFIAENLREHYVEKKREKKYIESLVADLKNDTTNIGRVTRASLKLTHGQDSLIDILNDLKDTSNYTNKAYHYYLFYATGFVEVKFNEKTMSQLLNAGNMRLIEKEGISDSIMDYNLFVKEVQQQAEAYDQYFKKTLDLSISIFDFTIARFDLDNNYKPRRKSQLSQLRLLTTDQLTFKKYAIQLSLLKGVLQEYILNLVQAKQNAISLIALLKKEYHLRD
jgi:hypothetical protein